MRRSARIAVITLATLAGPGIVQQPVEGQWLGYPTPGIPRLKDGKSDLAAPPPRTSEGKPDLSGVWHIEPTTIEEWQQILGDRFEGPGPFSSPGVMGLGVVSKYVANLFIGLAPDQIPMRPETAEDLRRKAASGQGIPSVSCLPMSFPFAILLPDVHKIVQTPGLTIVLMEGDNTYRQIYTDGRKLPVDPNPSWNGYSIGTWDGDTLVVETIGFNDRAWLDVVGHPRSEAMRITERYTRRDVGHLDVEMTFDDPKWYTRQFTIKITHLLQPDSDILENICAENEKDAQHIRRN